MPIEFPKLLLDNQAAVLGVQPEMEQILLNLLVNAWPAMAGGGTLTLTTARRDAVEVITLALAEGIDHA
jgi:C4-dicarboxylate-specific signal transduction histidine kinase